VLGVPQLVFKMDIQISNYFSPSTCSGRLQGLAVHSLIGCRCPSCRQCHSTEGNTKH